MTDGEAVGLPGAVAALGTPLMMTSPVLAALVAMIQVLEMLLAPVAMTPVLGTHTEAQVAMIRVLEMLLAPVAMIQVLGTHTEAQVAMIRVLGTRTAALVATTPEAMMKRMEGAMAYLRMTTT